MFGITLTSFVVQLVGWVGTVLFIVSYLQLNRGVWTLKTIKYHTYNILGSIFLVINTVYDYSYAAAMANLFWGVVAVYGFYKYRKPAKEVALKQES
ncbi:hypothetical protein BXY85_3076 [Roseivirga pacifica]|uniref:CBU-0592-like domain-containing protein n=1 Tax=Roseivirga pacifica TaxID=1267423 RepID=A0A1I0QW94_9BACT|nr:hypothetical protein [Roseivirga pacifica]RKQ42465.1 hypothetical protein BXY85_3076 [Roseivirga pacifica]SEW31888.1 hypothetical protein SAMN05216290_2797 [Roseivirga pacifica]